MLWVLADLCEDLSFCTNPLKHWFLNMAQAPSRGGCEVRLFIIMLFDFHSLPHQCATEYSIGCVLHDVATD